MPPLRNIVAAPVIYAVWTGLVVLALVATYYGDPYVFGFTTLILGGISLVPVAIGIAVIFLAKQLTVLARTVIAASAATNVVAVLVALEVLRGFKWA